MNEIKTLVGSTGEQVNEKKKLASQIRRSEIPNDELLDNLGLYLTRQTISRIEMMKSLYEKIINVTGVIMEFGVRWGQNMALFQNFRGIYEPYNYNRQIIGFDTFSGIPSIDKKDGGKVEKGGYSVTDDWDRQLDKILRFHNDNSPIGHKKKYELVKGDATITISEYLRNNPQTIIALAYFDFDIYEPTKICLQKILPHLSKGSVVAFDELNCHEFPGETIALKETLGLDSIALKRDPNNPLISYFVYGD